MKVPVLPSELLVEMMIIEADYQGAREVLTNLRNRRANALYKLWRHYKNPSIIAASLPTTVKKETVEAAVLKMAPPQDFELLELFELSQV
ncbi:hypothetical protein [Kitasatospora sp. NBC_01300]|uniref:hypothetical protein n=1 Tax=Kitasatospora sp. NBC_01300 TaxID=2903574 RepID=UPI002F91686B|nr:hypothetical protein OG556_41025 [Kitasatospora sp. NBC_01300]